MAEMQFGANKELIIIGVYEGGLSDIRQQLDNKGVNLTGLHGPASPIRSLREMSGWVDSPDHPGWETGVDNLSREIALAREAVSRAGVKGYELVKMSATLPNPDFSHTPLTSTWMDEPETDQVAATGHYGRGRSKYEFLSQQALRSLAFPNNRERYEHGLSDLAVVMSFREPYEKGEPGPYMPWADEQVISPNSIHETF